MKVVKETIRKYFKYVNWTQPILTSNTSNPSFVVSSSSELNSTYSAWRSFDSSKDDYCWLSASVSVTETSPQYYYIRTDTPLKISSILMTNRTGNYVHSIATGYLQASEDNQNWFDVAQINNSNNASGATWNVEVNESKGYKYHRFKITKVNIGNDTSTYATIGHPTITAEQMIEGSEQDHNYYEVISTYKLPKIDGKYYGIGG